MIFSAHPRVCAVLNEMLAEDLGKMFSKKLRENEFLDFLVDFQRPVKYSVLVCLTAYEILMDYLMPKCDSFAKII